MPVELSSLRNRLLLTLSTPMLEQMLPHLQRVEMPFRSSVQLADTSIDRVYFPESGWVSLLVTLEGGDAAEVGLVGREGLIGLPLLFNVDRSITEAMVQCAGTALAMEAGAFRYLIGEHTALRDLLLRYAFAVNTQLTMTAACNGRHLLDERLARWLLMSHDRVEGDDFPMTHEFLAMMLGVRRAGITTAAGVLQKAGLIRYEQGRIRVIDRPGLEAAACECHQVVTKEFHRLLGKPIFK